jgi:NIMA (never in mitosis gene a)-related kinase
MNSISKLDNYEIVKSLGSDAVSKTHLAKDKRDGSLWCLKQIFLKKSDSNAKQKILQEGPMLGMFKHENILKYRESFLTSDEDFYMVVEYADGGDLEAIVQEQQGIEGKYFPTELILRWFTQICLGLKTIHDTNVMHRDLKCENIFVTKSNQIKIGGFTVSKILASPGRRRGSICGTMNYMAPEIVIDEPYGLKADIWSLGVILYRICLLKFPFDETPENHGPLPEQYPGALKQLIADLLSKDQDQRPSVDQILEYLEKELKVNIKNTQQESKSKIDTEKAISDLERLIADLMVSEDEKKKNVELVLNILKKQSKLDIEYKIK